MKPTPFSISDFKAPTPIIIKESGGQPQGKSSNTGLYITFAFLIVTNVAWFIYMNKESERTSGIIRGLETDVTKLRQLASTKDQPVKTENQIKSQNTTENETKSNNV